MEKNEIGKKLRTQKIGQHEAMSRLTSYSIYRASTNQQIDFLLIRRNKEDQHGTARSHV